ncbi:hemogen [Cuculus canorus]|uniref:hemogen n=1 Tax=Cuculus canorus TaxID=55661 RepID=UPI0023AAB769|nr:hemogen [Cuculus canorus]
MESSSKDHGYSDASKPCSAAHEENAVPEVVITRRLRDRELLRKRKAEAQEKDSAQWILREQKNKRQRRGRGGRQRQGRQPAVKPSQDPDPEPMVKPSPEPEPVLDPQPDSQKNTEPAPSKLVLPVLSIPSLASGIQLGEVEGKLAAKSQDPTGEEEVLKPTEAGIPEALNIPLEIDHQDY